MMLTLKVQQSGGRETQCIAGLLSRKDVPTEQKHEQVDQISASMHVQKNETSPIIGKSRAMQEI